MKNDEMIFVVGPTAVGKTDVAFLLAQELGCEIVSCDAMQIYRDISIASNKPSALMIKEIPHHCIDVVELEQDYNVGAFRMRALEVIDGIIKRNNVPIVVGGSGMYMTVLLDGIFEEGAKDYALREHLRERNLKEGPDLMFKELQGVDPVAASKIHPNDARRIIRALEVFYTTQTPISELQKKREGLWGKLPIKMFALTMDRAELYKRIERRVDVMCDEGLVEEIRELKDRDLSLTAQSIIGVREIKGYLEGQYDLDAALELMKKNTRHLAKRQMTWFRKETRLEWIDIKPGETAQEVANQILLLMKGSS